MLHSLISSGLQYVYLTSNEPSITFFNRVYRRHTNFAFESLSSLSTDQPTVYKEPKLMSSKYNTINCSSGEESSSGEQSSIDEQCSICLSAYENDDDVCTTQCMHMYHHSCLLDYVKSKSGAISYDCPLCRHQNNIEYCQT